MDRRTLLASSVGLLPAATASAESRPLRSQLLGLWSLTEAVTIQEDNVLPWFGRRNPISGTIVFLDVGWMSVQIGGSRPEKVEREDFPKLSPDERLAFFDQYYAYYGNFQIDETLGTVHFHVIDSLLPFERGDVLKRKISIEGETLTLLTEPRKADGKTHFNRLVWKRLG